MKFILAAIVFVIVLAVFAAVGFGLCLAVVYGLMWLLNSALGLPYVPASSAAFAILMIGVLVQSVQFLIKSQNKLVGVFTAIYSLLVGPAMYAAAFNAHHLWTHAELTGGGRYLPGEYWAVLSDGASWVSAKGTEAVPALSGVFTAISNNALLTGIVASAFSTLIFQPMAKSIWRERTAAR